MIAWLQAVILGIVEGVTEFLPISSTGHLLVTEEIIGFQDAEEVFTVVVQIGAIAAVLWLFRHDLRQRIGGLVRREKPHVRFWQILAIATIPVGVIGLLIDRYMEQIATAPVIAATLIIGGLVLWWADRRPMPKSVEVELDNITIKQAWAVGLGQCAALVPGVSRAGATISSGLFGGLNRATATAFSFYLSIPVMVFASGYKLIKYHATIPAISGGMASVIIGVVVSFVVAFAVMRWLLAYVSRHNFTPFVYYRIILGLGIVFWLAVGQHIF